MESSNLALLATMGGRSKPNGDGRGKMNTEFFSAHPKRNWLLNKTRIGSP
jgi:hypothetical protein